MIDDEVLAGMRRMTHARYMNVLPLVHNIMPTEELRDRIDGPDIFPERRRFARTVELFECELRAPAPGVDWDILTRGAVVPSFYIARIMPTMADRLARRTYNEYCQPSKNFQPEWDIEAERIEWECVRKVDQQRASERRAKITLGLGILNAIPAICIALTAVGLTDAIVSGVLAVACLLAVAHALHVQKRHGDVDNWVRSRLVA